MKINQIHTYIPTPPEDWIPEAPKSELGEPPFENVDNPGNWCKHTFCPEFEGGKKKRDGGQYKHFFTDRCHSCSYSIEGKKKYFRVGISL